MSQVTRRTVWECPICLKLHRKKETAETCLAKGFHPKYVKAELVLAHGSSSYPWDDKLWVGQMSSGIVWPVFVVCNVRNGAGHNAVYDLWSPISGGTKLFGVKEKDIWIPHTIGWLDLLEKRVEAVKSMVANEQAAIDAGG
jgi:hypothetical protein